MTRTSALASRSSRAMYASSMVHQAVSSFHEVKIILFATTLRFGEQTSLPLRTTADAFTASCLPGLPINLKILVRVIWKDFSDSDDDDDDNDDDDEGDGGGEGDWMSGKR